MSDATKFCLTEYGNLCNNIIKGYPEIYKYYNGETGTACIPVSIYNDSSKLKDEVCRLLKSPQFKDDVHGCYRNWVIELGLVMHPITDEMVDGICIRDVESY